MAEGYSHGKVRPVDPDAEAERLVAERGRTEKLLFHSGFIAESWKLPGGTDVTNVVWVKVTAEHAPAVPLPAGLDGKLMDVIREHWPSREPGDA